MHKTPDFTAPVLYRDPAAALAQVQAIYQRAVDHLRAAMRSFVAGDDFHGSRVRACYPFVRLHTQSASHRGSGRLSYGFVAGPGRFETTITRPDLYGGYLLEQFGLLLANHGGELEVGISAQPIPIHFSFADHEHVEGQLGAERRALMRDVFDSAALVPGIKVPTTVIAAEHDRVIPPAHTDALIERFAPGVVQVVRIPGADHNNVGASEAFRRALPRI